jgi:DNA-binding phage protein
VELEKKGNPTLKTLLKLSDKLGMEFIIKDGKIEIK